VGAEEKTLDPNQYYKIHSQAVHTWRSVGQNPHTHK
jgi:lysyl-tRNA synthetase class 2